MIDINARSITTALHDLRGVLDLERQQQRGPWLENVHAALGELAEAIQAEVHDAQKTQESLDELNPDFQSTPGTERHNQAHRAQLIELGEKIHRLRADIRDAQENHPGNWESFRKQIDEVAHALEVLGHAETDFLQTTLNTNPGAGE